MKTILTIAILTSTLSGCVATAVTADQPSTPTVVVVPPGSEKIFIETPENDTPK